MRRILVKNQFPHSGGYDQNGRPLKNNDDDDGTGGSLGECCPVCKKPSDGLPCVECLDQYTATAFENMSVQQEHPNLSPKSGAGSSSSLAQARGGSSSAISPLHTPSGSKATAGSGSCTEHLSDLERVTRDGFRSEQVELGNKMMRDILLMRSAWPSVGLVAMGLVGYD